MKILAKSGRDDLAIVYVAETSAGKKLEFVESLQPPFKRREKWVLLVSSLYGCPVKCRMCDANRNFSGIVPEEDLLAQINFLVEKRFGTRNFYCEKFKIQFARIGEPTFNKNVLSVLKILPTLYTKPKLFPSVSTVAPRKGKKFLDELLEIKKSLYPKRFQIQFSVHSTDEKIRNWLMPIDKWNLREISDYGRRFCDEGGRKVTLNFAYNDGFAQEPDIIKRIFSPEFFAVKITPVNPTFAAIRNRLSSELGNGGGWKNFAEELKKAGYEIIVSVGEKEENKIGSNCGQHLSVLEKRKVKNGSSYSYPLVTMKIPRFL